MTVTGTQLSLRQKTPLPPNVVTTDGQQNLSNKRLTSPQIDLVKSTNGGTALVIDAPSNAVNRATLYAVPTGNPVYLSANGNDSNVGFYLQAKGVSPIVLQSGANVGLSVTGAPSSANNLAVYSASAGNAPAIHAVGTDTNVSLNLVTQGTGTVKANGNPVGHRVAVPANSTTAAKPGAWAANSSYIYTYTGDGTTHTWVRAAAASW